MSRNHNERSVGYLSASKDSGRVTVMLSDGEVKHYCHCDLADALEVLTGRRAFVPLREWIKK